MAGLLPPDELADADDELSMDRRVADGRGHDRQILVVGNGLTAAVTAGFLEQAGLDPVLTRAADAGTRSRVVTIWQPGLTLLERLGLRRPVERLGRPLARLDCLTEGRSRAADGAGRPSLVAIRRDRLGDLVERQLLDRVRTAERPVTDVEPTGTGVRATFEQGIEEPFDTVVTATRTLVPGRTTTGTGSVHVWDFPWPSSVPAPDTATEAWAESLAAFTVPVGDDTRVRLVAADETEPVAAVSVTDLDRRFGDLLDPLANPFPALDQSQLRYQQARRVVPASMCTDGVTLVGQAAHATIPGDCLGPALGIEDGWVLADALAYGPTDLDAALADYERRRRRRMTDVDAARHDVAIDRVPVSLSPLLRELCAARTLAFSHVLSDESPELARTVPDTL